MPSHSRKTLAVVAAAVLGAVGLSGGGAAAAARAEPNSSCFAVNQWEGWNASKDGDVLYLRVRLNDIYRVDLTPGSRAHKYGDWFLINEVRGSGWICSALDLDLMLSDHLGFRQPLIARSMRKLSPEEIAAIPRKELP